MEPPPLKILAMPLPAYFFVWMRALRDTLLQKQTREETNMILNEEVVYKRACPREVCMKKTAVTLFCKLVRLTRGSAYH